METISQSENNHVKVLNLEDALAMNTVSLFQYRLLLMCGFAMMADAMEINLLTFLSICAGADWELNDTEEAAIGGTVFAGIVVGSFFWGEFAGRYGRKVTYFISNALIAVGGFLSGASPSLGWLIFFRTVVGFGIGGAFVPFDQLAEFLPASHRGKFLIWIFYFWVLGSLLVSGIAWAALDSQGWRFLAYMTALPIAVVSVISYVYLPESPRWLLVKGRVEEATCIVRDAALTNGVQMEPFILKADIPIQSTADEKSKMEIEMTPRDPRSLARTVDGENVTLTSESENIPSTTNDLVLRSISLEDSVEASRCTPTLDAIDPEPVSTRPHHENNNEYFELVRTKEMRQITLPVCIVWMMFGFAYYGVIIFIDKLFAKESDNGAGDGGAQRQCAFDYGAIFFNALSEIAGVYFGALLIDYGGRVYSQAIFYGLGAVSAFLLGFDLPFGMLLFVSIIARFSAMAAANATWVATSELYPTELRTEGHAAGSAASKIAAFLSPFFIFSTQVTDIGAGILLAVMNIIAVIATLRLPETSGQELDTSRHAVEWRASQHGFAVGHKEGDDDETLQQTEASFSHAQNEASVKKASLAFLPIGRKANMHRLSTISDDDDDRKENDEVEAITLNIIHNTNGALDP